MHHFPLLSAFPSTFLANTAVRGNNQEDMKWEQEKAAKCGLFFMTRWLVLLFPPLQADNEVCFRITTPRTKPIRNTYLSCCSRQTVRWNSAAVCGFERRHQCPPPLISVTLSHIPDNLMSLSRDLPASYWNKHSVPLTLREPSHAVVEEAVFSSVIYF